MSSNRISFYEQDFENIFKLCKKQGIPTDDIRALFKPMLHKNYFKINRKFKIFLLTIAIFACASIIRTDTFSSLVSAIGRLILIYILPIWNWTALYNSKCLIQRTPVDNPHPLRAHVLDKFETDSTDCGPCLTLVGVSTAANVSYSFIEENYLERGVPLIITDSHEPLPPKRFFELILNNSREFLESEPCDLFTNLILKKYFTLQTAVEKFQALHPTEKCFLQLRNCELKAVKSSRLFIPRPYYYPIHLEPFYSSWLLMANNYVHLKQDLNLLGLILVQQISRSFEFRLRPKRSCDLSCPSLNIHLDAGEALIFSTDLWTLHYSSSSLESKDMDVSVATIMEIDWHL